MKLPSGIDVGTVTGFFGISTIDGEDDDLLPDLNPARAHITFTPSVPYLQFLGDTPITILTTPIFGLLDDQGYLCTPSPADSRVTAYRGIHLIANTDVFPVQNWGYNVSYRFLKADGSTSENSIATHFIQVVAGETIDLTRVVKVPGSPSIGVAASEANAAIAAQAALDARAAVAKEKFVINANDYGAVGDGAVDDTASLQSAADAANITGGRLFIPAGRYKTTGTLRVKSDLDATARTIIEYYGTGTALVLGDQAAAVFDRDMHAPVVEYKTGAVWDGTSAGVELVNLNTCTVTLRMVRGFEVGYRFIGRGTGFAYNTVTLGYSNQNRVAHLLTQDEGGWCNQNTFLGGRVQLVANSRGAVSDDMGAHYFHLKQGSNSVSGPNNNTFIGCTLEGTGQAFYRIKMEGARYNHFVNCRYENYGSTYRVRYEASSTGNVIQYGYDAWKIAFSSDATSLGNELYDGVGTKAQARSHSTQTVPTGVDTILTGWGSLTLNRVSIDGPAGKFTPPSGEWAIVATVAFASNGTGLRTGTINIGEPGGSVTRIAFDERAGATAGVTVLKLSGRWKFNGTQQFWVTVKQTSGAELSIYGGTGNTTLYADKLLT